MAAPTNAHQRVDITQEAEDVSDVIEDVSPEETPFYTNAPKANAENTTFQWHEDELDAAADPAVGDGNSWVDGDIFAGEPITPPVRLTNECQIQRKDIIVTRRARRLNKYGQRDELARQVTRKGRELKRDAERVLMHPQAKRADDGTLAPLLAGVFTWIANAQGAGRLDQGATATEPTGDGSDAPGDGTPRAISEAAILAVISAVGEVSNEAPNAWIVPWVVKTQISQYLFSSSARIAAQRQDQGAMPREGVHVVGAVDRWSTDHATVDIVPNRFMRTSDSLIYNTGWARCRTFDPFSTDAMAKTADTDDRMILIDHTLEVRNRRAFGAYTDIDPTAAMVA